MKRHLREAPPSLRSHKSRCSSLWPQQHNLRLPTPSMTTLASTVRASAVPLPTQAFPRSAGRNRAKCRAAGPLPPRCSGATTGAPVSSLQHPLNAAALLSTEHRASHSSVRGDKQAEGSVACRTQTHQVLSTGHPARSLTPFRIPRPTQSWDCSLHPGHSLLNIPLASWPEMEKNGKEEKALCWRQQQRGP